MSGITILTISGSLRKGSYNRVLLAEALRAFGPCNSIAAELNLPLYDGDLETSDGIPDAVQTLADQIKRADAILIASPEYNQNLSGVLKNALDWVSRVDGNPWADKPVAIMSAAAGRTGGARGQYSLRHCMTPFRARVLSGPEVLVAGASKAFSDDGTLTDERYKSAVGKLMDALRAEIQR